MKTNKDASKSFQDKYNLALHYIKSSKDTSILLLSKAISMLNEIESSLSQYNLNNDDKLKFEKLIETSITNAKKCLAQQVENSRRGEIAELRRQIAANIFRLNIHFSKNITPKMHSVLRDYFLQLYKKSGLLLEKNPTIRKQELSSIRTQLSPITSALSENSTLSRNNKLSILLENIPKNLSQSLSPFDYTNPNNSFGLLQ